MANISADDILQNIKKVSDKYQEIMLYLLQGKGQFVPTSLVDMDKAQLMLQASYEQFLASPEKFFKINSQYSEKFQDLVANSINRFISGQAGPALYTPSKSDRRFKDGAWSENIFFDFIKQYYLMSAEWMQKNIEQYELEPALKKHLEFATRQFIDALSPTNFIFSNPEVLRESLESGWQNIVQGLDNFLEDIKKSDVLNIPTHDSSAFTLAENIAATKGKVVFQNELMQLICYEPSEQTYQLPILIIPAWINKYYILDLSPHNSLVSYLVDNNFQVFIISWVNPDATLMDKNFEDYLKDGFIAASDYILSLGYSKINAIGYCIGGTLLSCGLSYLKTKRQDYINSASFFTTLLDFAYSGDVSIFVNESSIQAIEAEMEAKGYFDGRYLSNSFSLLRANDLFWSFFISNYLLGKTPMPFDLLYWNADPTNLPAKMNSYYLRNMYLNNLLKDPGALKMLKTPIDLTQIDLPTFFLAASGDHIAPWKSVYDGMQLLKGEKVFCLSSAGHVAGVVNPPSNTKYNYKTNNDLTLDSDSWINKSTEHNGSWWPYWLEWLASKSGEITKSVDYKGMKSLELAPGSYVRKRC